jgi:antitoxin (DNA-binding transcriptional repressor) of toxin-antitoxin stability system
MKRYTASQARQRFADVLDAAEAGEPVVIVRRRVRFAVRAEPPARVRRPRRRGSLFEILDPVVERGQWTWTVGPAGLRFAPRGRRGR